MLKESRRKQNIISIGIVVVGVIASFILFGPDKKREVDAEKINFATKVGIMLIGEENSKTAEISKTAIFEANQNSKAVAEQNGRIVEINFKVGDQVQKGQILALFDQSNLANSAKVSLDNSLENLKLADDNFGKTKKSIEETLEIAKNNRKIDELKLEQAKNGGDQDEIDLAEKDLENSKDAEDKAKDDAEILVNNAKIQLSQAQSTVDQNQILYEKTIIRAPISGVITAKKIENNEYILAGMEVADISGAGKFKANVFLNSFEIDKIKVGDQVKIENSGKEFLGEISALSNIANSSNNRFEVQIESLNNAVIEANQPAQIKISLKLDSAGEDSFFIPLSAVSIGQQKNTVFVEENGLAKLLEVVIGKTVGDQVEITEGLKIGDRLIVENNRNLREGAKIEI